MRLKHFLFALLIFTSLSAFSQSKKYWTSSLEMIFSWADQDIRGNTSGNVMRWAPVFNIQGLYNIDFTDNVGIFTGLGIRNVGYINKDYQFDEEGTTITVRKKYRTYNLGVPISIKIGNLNKGFVYAGYEIEFPFHYKEKTFRDEKKEKFTVWFSDRVETLQQSVMVGYTFTRGTSLKFKYYFTNFHNKDYTESSGSKPYAGMNANVWYISINFGLFKNTDFYYSEDTSKEYF